MNSSIKFTTWDMILRLQNQAPLCKDEIAETIINYVLPSLYLPLKTYWL